MGFYNQEDCDKWKWDKQIEFTPSEHSQEVDSLGFTYINKSDDMENHENELS